MPDSAIKHYAALYVATLLVMVVLDSIWIGGIARGFYKDRIGQLMELHLLPAILFYLMYAAGIVYFVNGSGTEPLGAIFLQGVLLGLLAYGTYDLTNLATLRNWSLSLVLVDMAWGAIATGAAAAGGRFAVQYFRL